MSCIHLVFQQFESCLFVQTGQVVFVVLLSFEIVFDCCMSCIHRVVFQQFESSCLFVQNVHVVFVVLLSFENAFESFY